jgi:hypothetical protein
MAVVLFNRNTVIVKRLKMRCYVKKGCLGFSAADALINEPINNSAVGMYMYSEHKLFCVHLIFAL